MIIANLVSYILVLLGAVNWGLYGIFNVNLVDLCFGVRSALAIIVYIAIALAAIWLIVYTVLYGGVIRIINAHREDRSEV